MKKYIKESEPLELDLRAAQDQEKAQRLANFVWDGRSSVPWGVVNVKIKDGVTAVRYSAFKNRIHLIHVDIPDSVVDIQAEAFRNCRSLKSIKLPPHLENLGRSAFWECYSLEEVIVPEGVQVTEDDFRGSPAKITYLGKLDPVTDKRVIQIWKRHLVNAYSDSRRQGLSQVDTVDAIVSDIGEDNARYIIAVMVNTKGGFDGRISDKVYDWAAAIAPGEDELRAAGIYYCDDIHPAHMDQIASQFMKMYG